MDIKSLVGNLFPVESKDENVFFIKTSLELAPGKNFIIFFENTASGIRIFDNKQILTFMQKIFDFKSNDVQTCLKSVFQVNGVSMLKGDVFVVANEQNFSKKFMDYLVCAGQLIRMYAFFDRT